MSHEVKILGFSERKGDHFSQIPESTIGLIEVKPPIRVGNKFGALILGKEQYGVSIDEVGSTTESTILIAHAGAYGLDKVAREEQIGKIAERVTEFTDTPGNAIEMLESNPFPEPQDRW